MNKIRVILADDSPLFLETALRALNADGRFLIVGLAADGEGAVRLAREVEPDAVLLDVVMPRVGGLQAAQILKSAPRPPIVVLISLHDDASYRDAALRQGADGYVCKSEFLQKVPELLVTLMEIP